MTDMFGSYLKQRVTLAHIWPASYTNWSDAARELSLPPDFYREPRDFLLLPEDVHVAFDHGRVIFVPATTQILPAMCCLVLLSASAAASCTYGKKLHLPKHDSGGVPYKR
jgi:hypothetical protein